jgi:hypothetical protein
MDKYFGSKKELGPFNFFSKPIPAIPSNVGKSAFVIQITYSPNVFTIPWLFERLMFIHLFIISFHVEMIPIAKDLVEECTNADLQEVHPPLSSPDK